MMKTAMSIGLMTVLASGVGVALAQPATPKVEPTQQTAPRVDPRSPIAQRADPSRENSATRQATPGTRATPATPAAPASTAHAAQDAASQHMALEAMDVNKDGSVSRQEYMAHYEGLFAKMKKDSSGKISLKDIG
jgi:hypothetical protein